MKKLVMAAMIPALLVACSEDKKQQSGNDNSGMKGYFWQFVEAPAITVKNLNGDVIANAQVLIGDALNTPFEGNFLVSDQNGQIALPVNWTGPLNVTVQAAGYMRATYMNQAPESLTIQLRPMAAGPQFEIKGLAKNLPVEDKDGFIDFGLVMPAFSKIDLLSFNINAVISPQVDRISVYGQKIDVPANISLPEQTEKFGFFSVTLEKAIFRLYAAQPGIKRVFAARGRFPFKSVVDDLRDGKEFYELINDFRINGGGIRDIDVRGDTKLDVPTRELNFTDKIEVAAPVFRADEIFMTVGLANQSGFMVPTDIKRIELGKTLKVSALPGSEQLVLGVLKRKSEMKGEGADRMSATLVPLIAGVSPTMLPLIANPTISNQGELLFPKFNSITGVNPIATYLVFTREQEIQQGKEKVKLMNPLWEVYATDWQERMKMPQWPNEQAPTGKKRWEVSFIGSQTASQVGLGPAMIEAATHVTHSSVSF
jgi:hypothetical protein